MIDVEGNEIVLVSHCCGATLLGDCMCSWCGNLCEVAVLEI